MNYLSVRCLEKEKEKREREREKRSFLTDSGFFFCVCVLSNQVFFLNFFSFLFLVFFLKTMVVYFVKKKEEVLIVLIR